MRKWNDERSELQAERDEPSFATSSATVGAVFDDRQVLGDGHGEGAWCWVLGAWCEGSESSFARLRRTAAEVESRAVGREEGEVNGAAPNGRDATTVATSLREATFGRWISRPSVSAERARRPSPQWRGILALNRCECDLARGVGHAVPVECDLARGVGHAVPVFAIIRTFA